MTTAEPLATAWLDKVAALRRGTLARMAGRVRKWAG